MLNCALTDMTSHFETPASAKGDSESQKYLREPSDKICSWTLRKTKKSYHLSFCSFYQLVKFIEKLIKSAAAISGYNTYHMDELENKDGQLISCSLLVLMGIIHIQLHFTPNCNYYVVPIYQSAIKSTSLSL